MFTILDILPPTIDPKIEYRRELLIRELTSSGYPFTKGGIKKFQKDNNLEPTGKIDLLTSSLISVKSYGEYKGNETIKQEPTDHHSPVFKMSRGANAHFVPKCGDIVYDCKDGRVYYYKSESEKIGISVPIEFDKKNE